MNRKLAKIFFYFARPQGKQLGFKCLNQKHTHTKHRQTHPHTHTHISTLIRWLILNHFRQVIVVMVLRFTTAVVKQKEANCSTFAGRFVNGVCRDSLVATPHSRVYLNSEATPTQSQPINHLWLKYFPREYFATILCETLILLHVHKHTHMQKG